MKKKSERMTAPDPQWREAAEAIAAAQEILVVSHIAPDGDAIGSLLGIAAFLHSKGKSVTAVVDDGVPPELRFIPGSESVLPSLSTGQFDLMITLDSSDLERIGSSGAYGMANSKRVINLDHHPTNTLFGDIHVIVPEAVAATEIAFDFLNYVGWDMSPDAAHALLTGLVTDTQGFRISATSSRTLEIAQALMQAGAPLSQIMAKTLNRRPFAEVALWQQVFDSVRLQDGLIYATITEEDVQRAGLEKMGDGGLVSYLVNVEEAKVSVVFKELSDRKVEVGFRAKPGHDVASLALQLGGGGHILASGCTVDGDVEAVRQIVIPLAHQVVQEGTSLLE